MYAVLLQCHVDEQNNITKDLRKTRSRFYAKNRVFFTFFGPKFSRAGEAENHALPATELFFRKKT